jgi:hypothetical protein
MEYSSGKAPQEAEGLPSNELLSFLISSLHHESKIA